MSLTVGIIGYGFVGKAMHWLFPSAAIYDPALGYENRDRVNLADVAFVCVPTPAAPSDYCGLLDCSAVLDVVSWCSAPLIVIRSTVNPGVTKHLMTKHRKHICYQPEYLGETVGHPFADIKARPFLVIGGASADRRALIELYTTVYNANVTIRQLTNYEAEVAKLSENRAIAFKVAQCQELYDACEAAGVDYYAVRDVVYGDDPRFNLWHTFVTPGNRGMHSKCIPKDVWAWAAWAESVGVDARITRSILEKNEEWVALNATDRTGQEPVRARG